MIRLLRLLLCWLTPALVAGFALLLVGIAGFALELRGTI